MSVGPPTQCIACTRLHHETPEIATCDAYPAGIPADILAGAAHTTPRGDEVGGRTFRQADTEGARIAMDAWRALARA